MPGWIRGNEVASSDSLKQINELQNENKNYSGIPSIIENNIYP